MSDGPARNDRVFVSHILKHKLAARRQHNGRFWSPRQRVVAGWVGRYIGAAIPVTVYDAATDTQTRETAHLVEDPSGKPRNVLIDDIRPASEPVGEV